MSAFTEEYRTFSAYICRSPAMPGGVKYPAAVSQTGISVSGNQGGSLIMSIGGAQLSSQDFFHQENRVSVYLYKDEYDEYAADVYILPADGDTGCLLNTPADAVDGSGKDASWTRDGDALSVKLPELLQCGTAGTRIVWSPAQFSESDVAHLGEITSESPEYTFNRDGYFHMDAGLSGTQLIPGLMIYVYYRLDGIDGWYLLGTFSFQTDIFASAVVTGCALCDRVKVLNNPYKPEDGYTYQYVPKVGGTGSVMKPEWIYDTRLRWSVEFYGETYWLKSVSPCLVSTGRRAAIIKSADSLPSRPDSEIKSTMVRRTLSETGDRIVPDHFYAGLAI